MKRFIMTEDALENYGEQYRNVILIVTHTATKYMPATKFYEEGRPQGYHPGYDTGLNGESLYDLKREDNGEDLNFSLYRWELKPV